MIVSPPRRVALSALLVALSLIITVVALEVSLRLFWDGYYVKLHHKAPRGHLAFHPTRGWATAPNVRIEYGKPEFSTLLVHNSLGFRGPELEAGKTPGRIRILALGDSMTYGIGVGNDETFSAELQRLDPRLEVINAGVPGYSPGQELLLLREDAAALSPDIVLVAFFWNDLVDAYRNQYARFTVEDGSLRFHFPSPATRDHPAFSERRERMRDAELNRLALVPRDET